MVEDIPPCHIRIDKEGAWFYQGLPIINRQIYLYLNQCLTKDVSGGYILAMDGEQCRLEVEDTPFVIQEVTLSTTPEGVPFLRVRINDETEEELKPDTIRVGKDDVLYCKVKKGQHDARFLRASYYQLAQFLRQDGNRYYLLIGDNKTYLATR